MMVSIFEIKLPNNGTPWGKVIFSEFACSIWGSGNKGDNLWGWPNKRHLMISKPKKLDRHWYIIVEVHHKIQPKYREQLAFIARYVEEGKEGKGVFCSRELIRISS